MGKHELAEKSTVALIHTLKTQGMHSEVLANLVEEMSGMKEEILVAKIEIETHVKESRAILTEVTEQVTINYDEQLEIRQLVSGKAVEVTKNHFKNIGLEDCSGLVFKAFKGMFINRIHSKLKRRMNVVRYTSIKRVDFKEAVEYLKRLDIIDFRKEELEPTQAVLKALDKEE